MFLRRAWRSVFDYVQSELLYSSAISAPPQKTNGNDLTVPTSPTFSVQQPDPHILTHLQQRERVYAFIRVPMSLEKFMLFAFWLCVDTFLAMFTFLPIRLLFGAFNFISRPLSYFFNWKRLALHFVCRKY